MGLKERVELMYTLDQLSDDQYATLISQILARDRTSTNQLLSGYFATNNNVALATNIKKAAKSMIQSQDPGDEPVAQTAMTDPHILSNIAQFLPNREVVRLELLSRRSLISLRNYPAIHTLDYDDISSYMAYCEDNSVTVDMTRFRNVRDLDLSGSAVKALLDSVDCGSYPIFKKLEKLECWDFRDMISKVALLCDISEVKSLSLICVDAGGIPDDSSGAKDLMTLILNCKNVRTLILTYLDTSGIDCIWTAKKIRESLPNFRILELRECQHSETVEVLFEAISSQILSFHLCEIDCGHHATVMLSALLQRSSDLRNLKELCWSICDGRDFADGVSELIGCQIGNLQKLYFRNEQGDEFDGETLTDEARRNLVCLFKRSLSHIELVDDQDIYS